MIFVAVSELKKHFPNHEILVLSPMDLERPETERSNFNFKFIGWFPTKFARCQNNPFLHALNMLLHKQEFQECEKIYRNCDLMIDISGYALGTKWDYACCNVYLEHLEMAQGFGIPMYLMPQSFGPFDFGAEHPGIDERCRKLLPTAKLILAREQDGYDALVEHYGLTNVRLAPDLVLNNRGIDLSRVFRDAPVLDVPQVEPGTIGVVPNGRNLDLGDPEAVLKLYAAAIAHALELGRRVCLLHHATSDAKLCEELKSRFADDDRVQLIRRELSCLEFNELVKHFDYLVASRFHSIVHAFKNGVPCIALGWAKKYEVLLEQFGQGDYLFDVRNDPSARELQAAMDRLDRCYKAESETIASCLAEVQKDNVFDLIAL